MVVLEHGATPAYATNAFTILTASAVHVSLGENALDRVGSAKSRQNVFVHLRRKNDFFSEYHCLSVTGVLGRKSSLLLSI